jgi:hypothetical protein
MSRSFRLVDMKDFVSSARLEGVILTEVCVFDKDRIRGATFQERGTDVEVVVVVVDDFVKCTVEGLLN